MSNEPNKVIYSMVGVSKFYDKKPVLKDIYGRQKDFDMLLQAMLK